MTSPTVFETNIERILEDHLHKEIDLIDARISHLKENIHELEERKAKLIRIADAAGIATTTQAAQ